MIARNLPFDPEAPVMLVDIGNTRTHMARWMGEEVSAAGAAATADPRACEVLFDELCRSLPTERPAAVVISSVVAPALARLRDLVADRLSRDALVIGDGVPLPLEMGVADPHGVGVDRVCAAAAAYDRLQAACTVVDFGTAVTVDLVNDEGLFLGGAILPGLRLQIQSLHEYTDALPLVDPAVPDSPFGRDTREAIQTGVCVGLAGAVRGLVERYAAALNRWPQVVATGGDVVFMASHCDFLDSLVSDLTLRGVGVAYRSYLVERGA